MEEIKSKYRKYESLKELASELERQKNNRYDVVVPTTDLRVIVKDDSVVMSVPQPNESGEIECVNNHPITEHAHQQVATKTDIPWRYYEKMRNNDQKHLLIHNVNTWLPSKDTRLVRVLDNEVRALLSDRYRCIDNHDVLFESLSEFERIQNERNIRMDVQTQTLTEQHMYVKATSPDLTGEVFKLHDRVEPVQGGIIISNSEVGVGNFKVEPYINVLACTNGLIREQVLKRRHVGRKLDVGFIEWSDDTKQLEDAVLWSRLRDMIDQTFDHNKFQKWVDEINGIAQVEIPKPTLAVDNIVRHFKLPENRKESLLNQFVKETPNQWGIAMAMTRCAQDEKNYEEQIKMEKIGAELLDKRITPLLTVEG